ncbi:MAG: 3-isopropylmalate dehydratase small subunit [Luminiphilus sp.]|nr:3-isopropylmalate dehydratase small subunit [Luminiphilus sp.]MDG1684009.1 3-isopropylmalate dehydratase small subunit [Luminiphilus sp.]
MTPFIQHLGVAAPLLRDNIDTDTIIPSREMRTVSRSGLADGLFAPWRYTEADARILNNAFVLNAAQFADASILLAGKNFGCGSSREHAVWALMESGFRVVIAPSFATIFRNNALRNGLLTVELDNRLILGILDWVQENPQRHRVGVDLEQCVLTCDPALAPIPFVIAPPARDMLLEGLDEIGLTERSLDRIAAFEANDRNRRPWAWLGSA